MSQLQTLLQPYSTKKNPREDQIDRHGHKQNETVDDNKLDTGWRTSVNIAAEYPRNCQEILDALAQF